MPDYRFEVWTRPESGTFARKFAVRGIADYQFQDVIGTGSGTIVLPETYPRLDEILYLDPPLHTNDEASLIRVFDGEEPVFDFYASRLDEAYTDVGDRQVKVTGLGVLSRLAKVELLAYDYPNQGPVEAKDWRYGDDATKAKNGGFEDYTDQNLGAELGDTTGWSPTPASGDFRAPTSFEVSTTEVRTGTYSFAFDPSTRHSGFHRSFDCVPGERVHIVAYLKEPTAAGKRYTMGAKIGSGWSDNAPGLNQFVYNSYLMAELGNVASTGTGLPGGSTDGTWQKLELDFDAGTSQESFDLVFQYDHHDGSNGPVAYVDDIEIDGFGPGLEPWLPFGNLTTFARDETTKLDDAASLQWQTGSGSDDADGFYQTVEVIPGATYYLSGFHFHADASAQSIRAVIKAVGGGWLASSPVSVPTSTWTDGTVSVTIPDGVTEVDIGFRYSETGTSPVLNTDRVIFALGLPATTYGQIWLDLLDDAGVDHAPGRTLLTWLTPTFTATLDSNGDPWDSDTVALRLKRGQKYDRIVATGAKLGYEHRIVWNDTLSRFEFEIFNPTGLGTDYSTADSPALVGRDVTRTGPIVRREPDATYALIEGDDGAWSEASSSALEAVWGRIEDYEASREYTADVVAARAAERIVEASNRLSGIRVSTTGSSLRPFVDVRPGDTIQVGLGTSKTVKAARRIAGIAVKYGTPPIVQYDFDSRVFTGASSQSEAVRRLLTKFEGLDDLLAPVTTGDGAGSHSHPKESIPTVLVAASNARAEVREMADLVCDGTADQEEIDAAFALLPSTGGRVLLSEGTFILSDSITFANSPVGGRVVFEGLGGRSKATEIDADALLAVPAIDASFTLGHWILRGFFIYGGDDVIAVNGTDYVLFEDVRIDYSNFGGGIVAKTTDLSRTTIRNCLIEYCNNAIDAAYGAFELFVHDNVITNSWDTAGPVGGHGVNIVEASTNFGQNSNIVVDNFFQWCEGAAVRLDMTGGGAYWGMLIANNQIVGDGAGVGTRGVSIKGSQFVKVLGNEILDCEIGFEWLNVASADWDSLGTIEANMFGRCDHAFDIDPNGGTLPGIRIAGNWIWEHYGESVIGDGAHDLSFVDNFIHGETLAITGCDRILVARNHFLQDLNGVNSDPGALVTLDSVIEGQVFDNLAVAEEWFTGRTIVIQLTNGTTDTHVIGNTYRYRNGGGDVYEWGVDIATADCTDNHVYENNLGAVSIADVRDYGIGTIFTRPTPEIRGRQALEAAGSNSSAGTANLTGGTVYLASDAASSSAGTANLTKA